MVKIGWASSFVVLWSSGFVGATLAAPAGSTAGVLAWRYVITALVLLAAVRLTHPRRPSRRDVLEQAALGVLAHVVFLGAVFSASAGGVSAATVALVCALQPMLVTVVGRLGWGDQVSRRQVVGLVTGLVAVATTVGGDASAGALLLVLPVLALVGLSTAALLERRWRPQVDVLSSLCVQVTVSAAVFAAYAALTGRLAVPPTRPVVGALVWLVVLSGLGGYASFVVCLRTLGSTTTSSLLYLTPPVTALWAWTMFGQRPTTAAWAGLTLGAAAVALAWPRSSDRHSPLWRYSA